MREASIDIALNTARLHSQAQACGEMASEQAEAAQALAASGSQIEALSELTVARVGEIAQTCSAQLTTANKTLVQLNELQQRVSRVTAQMEKFSQVVSQLSQQPIGDVAHDTVHARNKRIFDDAFSLAAVNNERGVLCQTHMRDTGEIITDFSLPLDVGGRRWGAVRLGVDYERFEELATPAKTA